MSLKTHIATNAVSLFARNGIKHVSMDDVARKANVSKRTLYDFFKDKEALLIEVLKEIRKPFTEYFLASEKRPGTALEVILLLNERMVENPTLLCDDFFEDVKRFPEALKVLLEGKQLFLKKLVELLKRGEKERVFMSDINYDIISLLAQKQMQSPDMSDVFAKYTHEEVHNTLFFIFLRGICTDTGRDILDRFVVKKRFRDMSGNKFN
ncbi:MAG: TetR/AcrR family transcriptional regulator [Tannerella sp.]|jgi:AcrR family transcriptional regulator|nr:TetR/AcrR family transcriptional regulator [Tannerella sp.]